MLETLLYPGGRVGPRAFRNAALILIVIGAALGLLPLLWPSLMLSFVSLVLLYPWAVIWVKRFHDAGKSGWMFLAVFVPWLAIGMAVSWFISQKFAPAMVPGMSPAEIMAMVPARMQAVALPSTAAATLIALAFALVVNEELKTDPAENTYGPPPAR